MTFHQIQDTELNQALKAGHLSRLLKKDIERRSNLPKLIAGGVRDLSTDVTYSASDPSWTEAQLIEEVEVWPKAGKNVFKVPYALNSGAGTFTITIPLNLPTVPLSKVWHVGSIYKLNGVTPTTLSPIGIVTNNTAQQIESSIYVSYECTKSELTINIVSYNAGVPDVRTAFFNCAVYYDDTGVRELGL